jgi:hypothetical protein
MAMKKNTKTLLIVGGLVIAAYLIYRWYENKQAANQSNSATGQLGTNLNSVNPALFGGGPSTELNYYAGTTEAFATTPVSQPSAASGTGGAGSGRPRKGRGAGARGTSGATTGTTSPTTPATPATPVANTPAPGTGGTLFTPVTAYGQTITTVQGLITALANAANPYKAANG